MGYILTSKFSLVGRFYWPLIVAKEAGRAASLYGERGDGDNTEDECEFRRCAALASKHSYNAFLPKPSLMA